VRFPQGIVPMADRLKGFQKGTIMAKIQAKMLDDESGQDSWIDVTAGPPSRGSTCSVTMCSDPALLVDAQKSAAVSRHSPKSLQSPNVEFDTTLDAVRWKLARDILPPGKNTDWIWDWSSRPEAQTSKQGFFRTSSNLVTPPNSPTQITEHSLSLRHSKLIRKPWFSLELVSVWIVSNVVTFVLGVCVGYFIIRRRLNGQIKPKF